ncbi:MAG: hypothetical protein L0Z50_27430 [Verrucomicrobiales bacterium]|nr:hypothetical protein [Verrucomicrobiales bacterium]
MNDSPDLDMQMTGRAALRRRKRLASFTAINLGDPSRPDKPRKLDLSVWLESNWFVRLEL